MFITAIIKDILPMQEINKINKRCAFMEYWEREEDLPQTILVTFLNGKSHLLDNIQCGCTAQLTVRMKTFLSNGNYTTIIYGEDIRIVAPKENPFDTDLYRDEYISVND